MRYHINFEKLINRLSPYYLSGRRWILFLQSLVKPLQIVNEDFVSWAKQIRIEAAMTSQVFKLEWFLNRMFSKYFKDQSQYIFIKGKESIGLAMYKEKADIPQSDNASFNKESEGNTTYLKAEGEVTLGNAFSFYVCSPLIDKTLIDEQQYLAMLSYYIDKYRVAGKTYKIIFE